MAYHLIIGASGAIGSAFISHILATNPEDEIVTFSRSPSSIDHARVRHISIEYHHEDTLVQAVSALPPAQRFDSIIIATGILHNQDVKPEKSLRELSYESLQTVFMANTFFPVMVAKHVLPHLATDRRAVMAFLSARVGSITDNQLGGWYAYRASKAALNMMVKNTAIEFGRFHKQAIIVGLHPGTVQSTLSSPYSAQVAPEKYFTPAYSVTQMMTVLAGLTPQDSGQCFAWDGKPIPA